VKEISVLELAGMHDGGEPFVLLDVREPDELALASIPWALAIPMGEVPQRLAELPPETPIAVLCHGGFRSARVTAFLNANGFPQAVNVAGGIDAWSHVVDPSVPTY
jgi:rhodanese-related sulfurtransferase